MSVEDWKPQADAPALFGSRDAVAVRLLPTRKRGWVERVRNWWRPHLPDRILANWLLNNTPSRDDAIECLRAAFRAGLVSAEQDLWATRLIWERWPSAFALAKRAEVDAMTESMRRNMNRHLWGDR